MVVATAVLLPPTAAPAVLTGSIEGYIYWGTQPVGGLRVGAGYGSPANVAMQPTTAITRGDGYFRLDGLRPSALYSLDIPAQPPYQATKFGGFYEVLAGRVITAVNVGNVPGPLLIQRQITNVAPAQGQVLPPGALSISWDPVPAATVYCIKLIDLATLQAVTMGICGGARSGEAAATSTRFQSPPLVSGRSYSGSVRSLTGSIATGSVYFEFHVR